MLSWDSNPEPEVTGYTLVYGTQPGTYTTWLDVGNSTSYTIGSLPDGTYYFAVRAYAADGRTSPFSTELVATIGASGVTYSGCLTSDPFVALGGGTCVNGGWLPPSGTGTSPAPAPAPVTQPTATQGCTTADPFAGMGGGTCYNGGWLPPGMTPPGGSTAPAPAPPPSQPPAPPPPTSTQGCTTPDPFAGMGGGTCYNGGWLPPGMTPPGGSTAPAPAPPSSQPAAPPPTSTQGCTTPDPFAGMGGGTCWNGGWLPPGMTAPTAGTGTPPPPSTPPPTQTSNVCTTPDPFAAMGGGTCFKGGWLPVGMELTVSGTLHVISAKDGLWSVVDQDGTIYISGYELPPAQLIEGAAVTFRGSTRPSMAGLDGVVIMQILSINIQH